MSKYIGLIGGGRWARVLARELAVVLPRDAMLVWVTQYHREQAERVACGFSERVIFRSTLPDVTEMSLQAAVVANDSHGHSRSIQECLGNDIPVLSEKPLALDLDVAVGLVQLARQKNRPLGIHLVMLHASYLDPVAEYLSKANASNVCVEWGDPWLDSRHGEIKRADWSVSILQDQLLHGWSILMKLFPNERFQLLSAAYQADNSVYCELSSQERCATLKLTRRASKRTRLVTLADQGIQFDFASEPGTISHGSKSINLEWNGARPLQRSLGKFLQVADQTESMDDWELQAEKHFAILQLVYEKDAVLRGQMQLLWELAKDIGKADLFRRRLAVDLAAVGASSEGWRGLLDSEEEVSEFIELAMSRGWLSSD